jgi:adenylate kinase
MGPPGSGKGTRARIIGRLYDVPVITTGDLLRDAVAQRTERGLEAKRYMERGELVPDGIVVNLMEERLSQPDCKEGFVLDGFPRNLSQAEALDWILGEMGTGIDFVLNVVIDAETIVSRLSLRRSCPNCGAVYHLKDKPPERDELCDECGARLIQRSDDRPEIIRHRLKVYEEKTRPLLDRYRKAGVVRKISGDLSIDKIPCAVRQVLGDSS